MLQFTNAAEQQKHSAAVVWNTSNLAVASQAAVPQVGKMQGIPHFLDKCSNQEKKTSTLQKANIPTTLPLQ